MLRVSIFGVYHLALFSYHDALYFFSYDTSLHLSQIFGVEIWGWGGYEIRSLYVVLPDLTFAI